MHGASGSNAQTAIKVVIACTVGNMVCLTAAVSSVFGVFLVPIATEFGLPRADISGVLGVIALVNTLAYPLVGRLVDRFGARPVILFGNLAFAPAVAALGLANGNLLQFYFLFALAGFAGSFPASGMFTKVVSDWFDENRGLMLGISAGVGNGVGATIMPIIAASLLGYVGWRGGYMIIGLIVFCLGFPVLYAFLKEAPQKLRVAEPGAGAADGPTLAEALKTVLFWQVLISIALSAGCLTAVFSHVVPVLTDHKIPLAVATAVMSTFALVCAGFQIIIGSLLDYLRTPRVVAPTFVAGIGGLALLQLSHDMPGLIAAGVLLGIGLGTAFGALPYFVSRYFGLRHYGSIVGFVYAIVVFAQGVTPFLMDRWFDHAKAYDGALVVVGACLALGALLIVLLPGFSKLTGPKPAIGLGHAL